MRIRIPLVISFTLLAVVLASGQDQAPKSLFDVGVFEVPEGDTEEVAAYLEELNELQERIGREYRELYNEYQRARAKVAKAQADAANAILDDPEISDDQFSTAARIGLPTKIRMIGSLSPDQKQSLLAMVKRQLSLGVDRGIQRAELSNASNLISYLERSGDIDLAIEACDSLSESLKESTDQNAKASVARFEGISRRLGLLGNPIELTGELLDGSDFDWSKYEGKVVLVDFWATWCGPCLAEAPNVLANYEKYHDRGFEVIGISLDTNKTALQNYVKSKKVPWDNLFKSGAGWKHPMAVKYGVSSIPSVFLVDRDGKVVSLRARGAELGKQLKKLVETKEDLQRENVKLGQQIKSNPRDASLLSRRANNYLALKDLESARSDWKKAVELKPELAVKAFYAFRNNEQWLIAAEFGKLVVDQKPDDIMRWLRLSAVLAASKKSERYGDFCQAMTKQFSDSEAWRDHRITCKSCLLLPDVIPMKALPLEEVTQGFEGENDDYTLSWSWNLQALVAYRNGDAELAIECLTKSGKHNPVPYARILNDAIFALAQHQLGETEKAKRAFQSASAGLARYRSEESTKYHHDVMIADIILTEAKQAFSE